MTMQRKLQQLEAALNYDFCPWANRWLYWMKNPLWVLLLAATTAGVCAVWLSPLAWLMCGAIAVVIIGGVFWPWFSLLGIDCELRFLKPRVTEGEPVMVCLTLRNRAPWPIWGLLLERGLSVTSHNRDSLALSWVPGWSDREYQWEYVPQLRGCFPQEAPCIETGFPFGLTKARRELSQFNRLIVWPSTIDLASLPDSAELRVCDEQFSDRVVGDFGDMLGTRLFRPGDALRRVHWSQTARQQTMIVTEHQAPIVSAIRILPDLDGQHHRFVDGANSLETVIRMTASLCRSLHEQHCYVECVIGETVHRIGRGESELKRLFDDLARVPRDGLSECTLLHLDCRHNRTAGSSEMLQLIVLTDHAFHQHPGLRHQRPHQKYITVRTDTDDESLCHCRPWLSVDDWSVSRDEIPRLWRRACHA